MRYGWTCDYADWMAVKLAVGNLKWGAAPFISQYSSTIPQAPGVYMLMLNASRVIADEQPWAAIKSPLYIGQSRNLKRRFLDHVENKSTVARYLEKLPSIEFCFAPADLLQINEIEAALIQAFGPRINRVQPAVIRARLLDPIKI